MGNFPVALFLYQDDRLTHLFSVCACADAYLRKFPSGLGDAISQIAETGLRTGRHGRDEMRLADDTIAYRKENRMRLDKYLKVSRMIKRRTVANDACGAGKVMVNGKPAKPSYDVKVGDVLELQFGSRTLKAEVLSLSEHVRKEEAADMYRILSEN